MEQLSLFLDMKTQELIAKKSENEIMRVIILSLARQAIMDEQTLLRVVSHETGIPKETIMEYLPVRPPKP